jgi:polyisoprenoid-binding protein YceI
MRSASDTHPFAPTVRRTDGVPIGESRWTVKKRLLVLAATLIVALSTVGFAGWYFLLRSDAAPRAAIVQTRVVRGGALDGTWSVAPGAAGSFVGYRVEEQFAFSVAASTATGRTSDVRGSLSITGATVHAATITANLRTLRSDRASRDVQIRSTGLESDRFPLATLVLAQPIRLGALPTPGSTVAATAAGDFTLHGVRRRVHLPVEGRWDGTRVQVVGHLPVVFGDYRIRAPSIGGFVSVSDHGEMEFQVFFTKS